MLSQLQLRIHHNAVCRQRRQLAYSEVYPALFKSASRLIPHGHEAVPVIVLSRSSLGDVGAVYLLLRAVPHVRLDLQRRVDHHRVCTLLGVHPLLRRRHSHRPAAVRLGKLVACVRTHGSRCVDHVRRRDAKYLRPVVAAQGYAPVLAQPHVKLFRLQQKCVFVAPGAFVYDYALFDIVSAVAVHEVYTVVNVLVCYLRAELCRGLKLRRRQSLPLVGNRVCYGGVRRLLRLRDHKLRIPARLHRKLRIRLPQRCHAHGVLPDLYRQQISVSRLCRKALSHFARLCRVHLSAVGAL